MIAAKTPISGQQQEACSSPSVDSGLFTAFLERGDVKIASVGHDHNNDYCGSWYGVELCYGGGAGFHAYGKLGWPRRARIYEFHANSTISTYKRLDPWLGGFVTKDHEQLWPTPAAKLRAAGGRRSTRSSDYEPSHWRPAPEDED